MAYAKQGAKLALGGRNEEKLKKTATLCEEQGVLKDDVSGTAHDFIYVTPTTK